MSRLTAAAFAALLLFAPVAGRAQTPAMETIKVGVLPAEICGEIFYGIDEGFFAKNGLNVEFQTFTNGGAIAAGIASGALDIGLSDLVSITSAHTRGLPFVYIAPGLLHSEKAPTFGIIVGKDSAIREARDFNGKTFAVNGLKNISQIAFEAWMDNNGGDSKSMKFIEMPFPAMSPALVQGTVAGGAPSEPALTNAADNGARIILMEKNAIAPTFMLSGWLTTREWAAAHPATVDKFNRSIRAIAEWANKNQKASGPILSKYTKIPLPVVEHMHRGDFATRFDPAQMQPMIEAAVKYGVIAKSFPVAELILGGK